MAERAADDRIEISRPRNGRDLWSQMYHEVYDDPRLDRNAHTVYMVLIRYIDFTSRTTREDEVMSRAELAKAAHISVDTFDRGLNKLIECGYVEKFCEYDPATKTYGKSRYVVFDERGTREARQREIAAKAESSDDPRNSRSDLAATSGQGGSRKERPGGSRSQRPGQTGTDPAGVAAHSGQGGRSQRPGVAAVSGRTTSIEREAFRETGENPSPSPLAADTTTPSGPGSEGEGEDSPILELVAEVRALRAGWGTRSIVRVLTHTDIAERPWPVVRRAMLAVAADPASQAPGRLLADGPWWNLPDPAASSTASSTGWCGECRESTRRVEHPDTGADLGPCPDCHYSHRAAS
ncbi:hypothetical protein AB0F17_28880 [Nonomuraea sp. NPDC026600]|uniref:hypothetical protein n=1 Tax=Nonomuraea sp. NPDC026600 TaxID=3155363 RepID=UPI0034107D93